MATSCQYTTFDATPGSVHNRVVDLVPEGARVLEFGCATGYMSEMLKARRGSTVTGIEIDPQAAEIAQTRADRVFVGDADELDFDDLLDGEQFDAILFADVLEHLRRPDLVLRRIGHFLADDGAIIASIPNIAHGSVRLSLLAGEFRYRTLGLLDDTHLRFFTLESVRELFEGSGYLISELSRARLDIDKSEIGIPALPERKYLLERLADDPEATTYQFIVCAVRSDAAHQLMTLRDGLHAAHTALEQTREELDQTRDQLAKTRAELEQHEASQTRLDETEARTERLSSQVEALIGRERELRELLLEAHDQLIRRDDEIEFANEELDRLRRQVETGARELEDRAAQLESREERIVELDNQIHWMQERRVWRLATRWWRLKRFLTLKK
jgi:2-polyprenyl-3-methyl-5-hydroxy-6-metoxy-1,4-benzoquinol methylase